MALACPSFAVSFGYVPSGSVGSGWSIRRRVIWFSAFGQRGIWLGHPSYESSPGCLRSLSVYATCLRAALALVYHPMLGRLVQCPRAAWLWLAIHVWTFLGFFASRVSSWGHAVAWSCVPRATNLAVYWQVNRKLVGNCSLRRWSDLVDHRPLAYHASSRGGRGSGGRSIFAPPWDGR